MPNLRIIYDNAIERATLTASSEASAAMDVEFLQTETKTDVWRSTGLTETITAIWPTVEEIGGVALTFCNLTEDDTIRVRGYADVADVVALFDSGVVAACPGPALGLWGWGSQSLGSNAYAYGGGTQACVWIAVPGAVEKLVIDIVSVSTDGYIEAGGLFCGAYWSPEHNPEYGAPITPASMSKQDRTKAGNLITDRGTKHRRQSISLPSMSPVDRAALWDIFWGNGMDRPVWMSLYPEDEDALLEQSHQMCCKLVANPSMSTPSLLRYATTIEFEEI